MRHGFIDQYSHTGSLMARLDPRIKIVCLVSYMLCVLLTRPGAWTALILYGAMAILLIAMSGVPFLFILKRIALIIPFVLLTALFLPFLQSGDATPLLIGGYRTGTTFEGWILFWGIVIKSSLCIACLTLFLAGTPFPEFLKGMEKLKFPGLITMILTFMYRYIFVIEDEAMRMWQARKSRTVGGSAWFHLKMMANLAGVLFLRSYERAERVYFAMCSRGYDGRIRYAGHPLRIEGRDMIFLILMLTGLLHIKKFFC